MNEHGHDWEAGSWGVLIGVSRCRECGKVAMSSDFKRPEPPTPGEGAGR